MKYKLIALDMDGTLTNSQKEISVKTKNKLIDLNKRGINLVLASGRPIKGLYQAEELAFSKYGGYLLAFNGSRVMDYRTKQIVNQRTFSLEIAREVYQMAKENGLAILTYGMGYIITEDDQDQYVIQEQRINQMPIKKVDSLINSLPKDINKLLITGHPDKLAVLVNDFIAVFAGKLAIYRSAPFFIEVNPLGVDKASALADLAAKLAIKPEEIMAFGDGYNDIEMISSAGMGISMANGIQEAKAVADYITASNDREGVYEALERFDRENFF